VTCSMCSISMASSLKCLSNKRMVLSNSIQLSHAIGPWKESRVLKSGDARCVSQKVLYVQKHSLTARLDLEISKPQKNSRQAQAQNAIRRDRSPDRARDNQQNRGGRRGNNGGRNGSDSYDGRSEVRDEYGRPLRMRRSPSPPRGSFRSRDEYGPRGRDPYDSRDHRRSRSRSPYGNRDNIRYRERSPSPRRNSIQDSDLQIPRREWNKIPDVQIIMMEQLDRGFVDWVEKQFLNRGLKTEVMILSPRLSLEAVIQRQIIEGVHAVSQLSSRSQNLSKIPLQVFKRQGGASVQWEEYQDLDPHIAAELVLREKNTQPPPQPPPVQYTPPQYVPPPQYQPPPQVAPQAAPNLANMIDQNTLQSILGTLNNAQQQNTPAVASNSAVDLAALIGGLQNQQRQQSQSAYTAPVDPYAGHAVQPQQANYMGQQGQPPQQSAQQVQNIMATLNKYRQ
jgi:nuclear polyadenylated RNA-binding protein 3